MKEIGTLRLQTITHALVGGYNTFTKSQTLAIQEYPRPTAIRGAVRWWLRALLAGALWEAGVSDKKEIEQKVKDEVKKIFGSTQWQSKVLLRLEYNNNPPPVVTPSKKNFLPPRLHLLSMGVPSKTLPYRLSCYEPGWKLTLKLLSTGRLGEGEERVVLWSAVLYSLFGGIGAITRRGFGALKIERCGDQEIDGYLKRLYEKPSEKLLREMVAKALEAVRNLLKVPEGNPEEIPPWPLISKSEDIFMFQFKNISFQAPKYYAESMEKAGFTDVDTMYLLSCIGDSTLKVRWKMSRGDPGTAYDTWILGLPRTGVHPKTGKKDETGYFEDKDKRKKGRRPSAISIKPFNRENNEWTLLIYGFLSSDWPAPLYHHSHTRGVQLVTKKPNDAFREAWQKIPKLIIQKLTRGGR